MYGESRAYTSRGPLVLSRVIRTLTQVISPLILVTILRGPLLVGFPGFIVVGFLGFNLSCRTRDATLPLSWRRSVAIHKPAFSS